MGECKKTLPRKNYIEVKFEDVVTFPENILTKICKFINLQYDAQMMNYPKYTTYSKPDPSLTNQWKRKLSIKEKKLVEYKTKELMLNRNYLFSSKDLKAPSSFEQLLLKIQNKYYKINFRINRFGTPLVICNFLARRLNLKTWERNLKLKMNTIVTKHLK